MVGIKITKIIQYGLPRLDFIAIFVDTVILAVIEKFDKLDDSYCFIAQLVEPATVNRVVLGSSPSETAT